jgi:MoxR-like ATPase
MPAPAGAFETGAALAERLLANVETVVVGKREATRLVIAAFACGGHVLLEDVPGTAKTILARSIAQTIRGASFNRIQCTPDLQPTDVTGLSIYNQQSKDF